MLKTESQALGAQNGRVTQNTYLYIVLLTILNCNINSTHSFEHAHENAYIMYQTINKYQSSRSLVTMNLVCFFSLHHTLMNNNIKIIFKLSTYDKLFYKQLIMVRISLKFRAIFSVFYCIFRNKACLHFRYISSTQIYQGMH